MYPMRCHVDSCSSDTFGWKLKMLWGAQQGKGAVNWEGYPKISCICIKAGKSNTEHIVVTAVATVGILELKKSVLYFAK